MKKLIPLMLVMTLLLSMSLSAVAAGDPVQESQSVNVTYVPAKAAETVISVDIEWEGMDFTYKEANEKWNANTHQYDKEAAGWAEGCGKITITNHSSVILQAGLSYEAVSDFDKISMAFTNEAPYIGSAYTNETGSGAECDVQVLAVPKGELSGPLNEKTKIGTVKVVVEAKGAVEDVVSEIEGKYDGIEISDGSSLERGAVYYTASDLAAVKSAHGDLMGLFDEGVTNEAQINAALNPLIKAYYNGMKIGQ